MLIEFVNKRTHPIVPQLDDSVVQTCKNPWPFGMEAQAWNVKQLIRALTEEAITLQTTSIILIYSGFLNMQSDVSRTAKDTYNYCPFIATSE